MSNSRFTKSKDGVMRTTLTLKIRLTRDELEVLASHANRRKRAIRDVCETAAGLAIENLIAGIESDDPATVGK